jgi:preprotein translocase subunit Sec61beta
MSIIRKRKKDKASGEGDSAGILIFWEEGNG